MRAALSKGVTISTALLSALSSPSSFLSEEIELALMLIEGEAATRNHVIDWSTLQITTIPEVIHGKDVVILKVAVNSEEAEKEKNR